MSNRENFQIWFANHIRSLAGDHSAGFLITMLTFPLLERYLRQLTGAEPNSPKFIAGVRRVLPELRTDGDAKEFWTNYRHGLLHNVTMSTETHGLTHDSQTVVEVLPGGKVWLNPVLFSERVLTTVEKDFATFEGGVPALPAVSVHGHETQHPGAPHAYIGTSTPPGQGKR